MEEEKYSNWIKIIIDTSNRQFQNHCKSPSDFFRKLSNSKLNLSRGINNNNRMFWQRNFLGGVYYYIPITEDNLKIIFIVEMKNVSKIDGIQLSLRARIKRILKSIKTVIEISKISINEIIQLEKELKPYRFQRQYFGHSYKNGTLFWQDQDSALD